MKAVDAREPGVRGRLLSVLEAVTEDGRTRPRIRAASAAGLDTGHDAALDRLVAPARSAAPFVRVSS